MRRLPLIPLILLLAISGRPERAAGQDRNCVTNAPGRTENMGGQVIIFHDPFTVNCDDGAQLRANSGRLNQAIRELQLEGNVFFRDSDRSLTANQATYNGGTRRLYATGDVVFDNMSEGSTLRGPELEYLRATEQRPLAQVNAGRRPTLLLRPGSENNTTDEPLELVADQVTILGEDDLTAIGSVVITRTDLNATSRQARYESQREFLQLTGDAVVENEDYQMTGEEIRVQMFDGSLQYVHSYQNASMRSENSRVEAYDLQLFFAADSIRRAVAQTPPDEPSAEQPRAWSSQFEISADSLDAAFQSQRIHEVVAIGKARAESVDTTAATSPEPYTRSAPDSLGTAPADSTSSSPPPAPASSLVGSDWIVGDTIHAFFEALPDSLQLPSTDEDASDIAAANENVELRTLIAIGSAQSLYRVSPQAAEAPQRNINFLVGDRIELALVDGELDVADVQGLKRGVYLESGTGQGGAALSRDALDRLSTDRTSVNSVAPELDASIADRSPDSDPEMAGAGVADSSVAEPQTPTNPAPSLLGEPTGNVTTGGALPSPPEPATSLPDTPASGIAETPAVPARVAPSVLGEPTGNVTTGGATVGGVLGEPTGVSTGVGTAAGASAVNQAPRTPSVLGEPTGISTTGQSGAQRPDVRDSGTPSVLGEPTGVSTTVTPQGTPPVLGEPAPGTNVDNAGPDASNSSTDMNSQDD